MSKSNGFRYKAGERKLTTGVEFGRDSPSPNAYTLKSIVGVEGLSKSMHGRIETKLKTTPGPGHYSATDCALKAQVIGKRTEQRLPKFASFVPPPGTYSPKPVQPKAPSWDMGVGQKGKNAVLELG